MTPKILNRHDARLFLLQGLWFQRAVYPGTSTVRRALEWSYVIANEGNPLPPTGFVADVGHIALGGEGYERAPKEVLALPGVPPGLIRTYEDLVLGKIYADWSFERASDALKRIIVDRALSSKLSGANDVPLVRNRQALGLAYIFRQLCVRGEINGIELSPSVVLGLLKAKERPEDLLRQGWESLHQHGPLPCLIDLYEQLIAAARRLPEVLALEDVLALEQQSALLPFAEYHAHRQVLQLASQIEEYLRFKKVSPLSGRHEVPTRVLHEDTYPVGGFTSISTRGSIESLLHSQLAFMESDPSERPDLFDMKFLRDELYYYSRDENQFLRRRRTFVFVLQSDLSEFGSEYYERIVLPLATLVAAVRRLADLLGNEALRFEFLFVMRDKDLPLDKEAKLLSITFRNLIENNMVCVEHLPFADVEYRVKEHGRRSLCHCLVIGVKDTDLRVEEAVVTGMRIDGPQPVLRIDGDDLAILEGDEPFEKWTATLLYLLQLWI